MQRKKSFFPGDFESAKKNSFFPGDFESGNSPEIYCEKNNSQGIIFRNNFSCQRVRRQGPSYQFPKDLSDSTPRHKTNTCRKLKKNQSRLNFSIPLENFNLARKFQSRSSEFPTKIGVWWVARLKFSISLENFKILNFFNFLGP